MHSVYVQFTIPMHNMQKRSLNDLIILTLSHLGLLLCLSYIQLTRIIWLILIVHLNQRNNADAKEHVGSVVNNPANSSVKTEITLHFKTSAKKSHLLRNPPEIHTTYLVQQSCASLLVYITGPFLKEYSKSCHCLLNGPAQEDDIILHPSSSYYPSFSVVSGHVPKLAGIRSPIPANLGVHP